MSYTVGISRRAKRDLERIPSHDFEAIMERIRALSANARPHGCKKMKGTEHVWRVRAGDYRILYEIEDAQQSVTIVMVGHRREIYR